MMDPAAIPPRGGWPTPAAYVSLDALAHDLGFVTAIEGFDLETAIERLRTVRHLGARRERRRFDLSGLAIALTNGWVAGVLEGDLDVSLEVLRMDAHERYRRCRALGLDPARELALVVFRATVDVRRDALPAGIAVIQALARADFTAGETIAVAQDKVLVLVERGDHLAGRVHGLVASMNATVAHLGVSATGWIEPLSSDPVWLDDHLSALLA